MLRSQMKKLDIKRAFVNLNGRFGDFVFVNKRITIHIENASYVKKAFLLDYDLAANYNEEQLEGMTREEYDKIQSAFYHVQEIIEDVLSDEIYRTTKIRVYIELGDSFNFWDMIDKEDFFHEEEEEE